MQISCELILYKKNLLIFLVIKQTSVLQKSQYFKFYRISKWVSAELVLVLNTCKLNKAKTEKSTEKHGVLYSDEMSQLSTFISLARD